MSNSEELAAAARRVADKLGEAVERIERVEARRAETNGFAGHRRRELGDAIAKLLDQPT